MKSLFLTGLAILIVFNYIYCSMNPSIINIMYVGALTGLVASAIGVLTGVTMLGFSGEILRLLFGITALLNILFSINIAGFRIGIGLINNIMNIFIESDLLGIGYLFSSCLSMLILASGLLIIVGGSD